MSTNILAASGHLRRGEFDPNFKGWPKSTITLYFGLLSKASYNNAHDDWFYIKKHTVPGQIARGREWSDWTTLAKELGISRTTLTRARANLLEPQDEKFMWGGCAVVRETKDAIIIRNHEVFSRYNEYIDHSVMEVLIMYAAAHDGDATIMRLYSTFKMMKKEKCRFCIG